MITKKWASIDIGSNTLLLLVSEVSESGVKECYSISKVAGLGRGIDKNKEFCQEAKEDVYTILKEFRTILEKEKINLENVICTATEAARVALNARSFFDSLKAELGFNIQIINAKAEAYFTALGVSTDSSLPLSFSILDIGGASTEIIALNKIPNDVEILRSISLPVGSVRCSEWAKENQFEKKMHSVLDIDLKEFETPHILCVAGSMTSLAGIFHNLRNFEEKLIHGSKISLTSFSELIKKIASCTSLELLNSFPFLGKRATTILAGALVGREIGKKLGVETFEISTLGLRHGSLKYMLKKGKGEIDDYFIY